MKSQMSKRQISSNARNRNGSGLIEGVFGLMTVVGGGVMMLLLILNAGAGMYFKQKMMPVASMAAQYAAGHASDSNLDAETSAFVNEIMPKLGLNPSNLKTDLKMISVGGDPGMQVTITNSFPLFGNANLANGLVLSDTEVWVY